MGTCRRRKVNLGKWLVGMEFFFSFYPLNSLTYPEIGKKKQQAAVAQWLCSSPMTRKTRVRLPLGRNFFSFFFPPFFFFFSMSIFSRFSVYVCCTAGTAGLRL